MIFEESRLYHLNNSREGNENKKIESNSESKLSHFLFILLLKQAKTPLIFLQPAVFMLFERKMGLHD